jgi:hypothetical protein
MSREWELCTCGLTWTGYSESWAVQHLSSCGARVYLDERARLLAQQDGEGCLACRSIGESGDEVAMLRHHHEAHGVPLPPLRILTAEESVTQ